MSGKSSFSALQTAPIVSRRSPAASRLATLSSDSAMTPSPGSAVEEGQLELPDLQLVAVGEPVRLDPMAVDVRAVQAAGVLDVEAVRPAPDEGVVTGDRDVVEQDVGLRRAADGGLLAG